MTTDSVLKEVSDERLRQDAKWGGPTHDDNHPAEDFLRFVNIKLQRAWDRKDERRRRLIQIAALAVAAVESIDRRSA